MLQSTLIWCSFNTYCVRSGSRHRFKVFIKVCQMEMSVMKWEHTKICPENKLMIQSMSTVIYCLEVLILNRGLSFHVVI